MGHRVIMTSDPGHVNTAIHNQWTSGPAEPLTTTGAANAPQRGYKTRSTVNQTLVWSFTLRCPTVGLSFGRRGLAPVSSAATASSPHAQTSANVIYCCRDKKTHRGDKAEGVQSLPYLLLARSGLVGDFFSDSCFRVPRLPGTNEKTRRSTTSSQRHVTVVVVHLCR